jgi:hypothetical protein
LSWVSGPTVTDSRHFNVTVGTHVVLLKNGKPRETVYTAGRNGGIINLFSDRFVPLTGDLEIMTFRSAMDVKPASTDVRLRDGATITVSADLQLKPAWQASPRLLLTWVERYGANPGTIERAASAAVDADFAALVTSSFGPLTNDKVHAATDKRSLLKSTGRPSGLLAIDQILNVKCTRDTHAETAHGIDRSRIVETAQAELDTLRFQLSQVLDELRAQHANRIAEIRAQGEMQLELARAANTAKINGILAQVYGLSTAEIAYPQLLTERQRVELDTVRSVLTTHADMLPLLAEMDGASAVALLHQMFSGAGPRQGSTATLGRAQTGGQSSANRQALPAGAAAGSGVRQRWPSAPDVAGKIAAAGITDNVVGSATCAGPQGVQRIALTASGKDQMIGGVGESGATNAIVVRERGTLLETVNAVLAAAAQWSGYKLGYKPISNPHALLIDIDQVIPSSRAAHPDALGTLAAWVNAINTLAADTAPPVAVSLMGQR